ncbi:hypothetical protein [Erythrobacter sp.]|uniref:hypothetical protein n=1 Tax=Erythrobacter sp. TaxID=1042 RepID=UPI0025D3EF23|nr:hypothetical protein [Erythrobacter sp.]
MKADRAARLNKQRALDLPRAGTATEAPPIFRPFIDAGTMPAALNIAPCVDSSGAMDTFTESARGIAMLLRVDLRTQE